MRKNDCVSDTDPNYKYQFNGKEFQDDFGVNFSDFGARMYDSSLGRFLQHDPLSSTTLDIYGFGYNNPIRFIDPTGMIGQDWVQKNNTIFFDASIKNTDQTREKYGSSAKYIGEAGRAYASDGSGSINLNSDGSFGNGLSGSTFVGNTSTTVQSAGYTNLSEFYPSWTDKMLDFFRGDSPQEFLSIYTSGLGRTDIQPKPSWFRAGDTTYMLDFSTMILPIEGGSPRNSYITRLISNLAIGTTHRNNVAGISWGGSDNKGGDFIKSSTKVYDIDSVNNGVLYQKDTFHIYDKKDVGSMSPSYRAIELINNQRANQAIKSIN